MDTVNIIITVFLSSTAITGLVGYLAKKIIDKYLEHGLEKYKADLQLDTEKYKSELKRIELEHQIKYSKLHEERAQTIKELYSFLIDLQKHLILFTTPFQGQDWTTDTERENDTKEVFERINQFFLKNRIYLSLPVCDKIQGILTDSWGIIVQMSVTKRSAQYNTTGPEKAQSLKEWQSLYSKIGKEIDTARLSLEDEFRKIIGAE